ncbi:MAG: hypothetical protein HYT79_02435 [Elusimicrobia bacterium]|nr:hypothetical protein [Elusimicrobiota bacterium]
MIKQEFLLPEIEGEDQNLETFDPNAFVGNDKDEQKTCNFVLMLALFFNDLKNLVWAFRQLKNTLPKNADSPSVYNGHHGGFEVHIQRLFWACVFELTDSIKNNENAIKHSLFVKTIHSLPQERQRLWDELYQFSVGSKINKFSNKLLEELAQHRNNIAFHYSQNKVIANGYKDFFAPQSANLHSNPLKVPYISRAASMAETKFYFADAAAQECLKKFDPYATELKNLVKENILKTVGSIVINFIQVRGFAWQKPQTAEQE